MKKIISILLAFTVNSFGDNISSEHLNFFESKIRPILIDKCYNCHSQKSEKIKGGFRVDTKQGMESGGESGTKLFDFKNPDKSYLIRMVKRQEESSMPPKESESLTSDQIDLLVQWIKIGAPDPRDENKLSEYSKFGEDVDNHWAYKPIFNPKIPNINNPWVSNDIDKFILKNLNELEIDPSPIADKFTLIRRIYYNLTGLPPTEEEMNYYIIDPSPDSYSNLVKKLLSSIAYGEKYARHWLDVARYSDTTGSVNRNREYRYTYSWTYRNYVINSFNGDKPFNKFVKEQIAADLMDVPKENLAALGFLTLGKNNGNINDIIDDQIDVISKGFMASTIVCARCHDHKFDPFTMKDYYALHGILNSSIVPSDNDKPLIVDIVESEGYKDYLSKKKILEDNVESFIDTRFYAAMMDFKTNTAKLMYGNYVLSNMESTNRNDFVRDQKLNVRMLSQWSKKIGVSISVGRGGTGSVRNNSNKITDPVFYLYAKLFDVKQENFKESLNNIFQSEREKIDPFLISFVNPTSINNMYDLCMSYQSAILKSDETSYKYTKLNKELPESVSKFRESIYGNGGPLSMSRNDFQRYYSSNADTMRYDNQLRNERGKLIQHELDHPYTPARAMVIIDKPRPSNSNILIKGDPRKRGESVERRFVELLSDKIDSIEFSNKSSGRLELAKSIVSDKNPLTARVIVNRVWQWNFGKGLLKNPDDFGIQVSEPIHMELLDHLSHKFIENNWSIKWLNEYIVNSSTYKQQSILDSKKLTIDPYNEYYWRFDVNKLKFEELRDTILFVGGKLDRNVNKQPVDLFNLDGDKYTTVRSIYGIVDRGNLPEVFTTFDFATPEMTTGKRFDTIVPKQALFLMNNPMVIEQVRNLINRDSFKKLKTNKEKVTKLYNILYQRNSSEMEMKVALFYVNKASEEDIVDYKREYDWHYGIKYGDVFTPMKEYTSSKYTTIKGNDKNIPYIGKSESMVTSHPNTLVTKRWICNEDGDYNINLTISPKSKNEDGILYGITLNGNLLKSFVIEKVEKFSIPKISIKNGDILDFSTSCNKSYENDKYHDKIIIKKYEEMSSTTSTYWDSDKDFHPPIKEIDKEMNGWERFAHILLMSNEMVFIN